MDFIQIGWNNPKNDSGESNRVIYGHAIFGVPIWIAFHVITLTYGFRFYFILRLTTYQPWSIPIPLDPLKRDCFPDNRMLSLSQGESVFLPVL